MVQRAVRNEGAPRPANRSSEEETGALGRDWVILKGCRLGRPARAGHLPTVLLHQARGVAVLDILPSDTEGAVEALRARLEAARFHMIFAGHLPAVHLRVEPRRLPLLPSLLDEAFAEQPPLRLPGGDAWVGVAARALTVEQPPLPRPEPSRRGAGCDAKGPPAARRPARRVAAASRKAGALLLCLMALGGVLGLAVNGAPAPAPSPEAAPVATAPPAAERAGLPMPVPPPSSLRLLDPVAAAPPPTPPRAPDPVQVEPPPPPAAVPAVQGESAAAVAPPVPSPALPPLPPAIEAPSPPSARPPPRRPDAAVAPQPPPARRAPERAAAPRRPQGEGGAGEPAAGAVAAPRMPETSPDRCRRVSGLAGSGAPLAEADMRFFNENCIRW